jgi:hypothetical protein
MIFITLKRFARLVTKRDISSATEPRARRKQGKQQRRQQKPSLLVGVGLPVIGGSNFLLRAYRAETHIQLFFSRAE